MTHLHSAIESVFQRESRIVIAALLSTLCDIELAEDALQDALIEALRVWERTGIPAKPGAWIMTVARRKAIDRLRRESAFQQRMPSLAAVDEYERQEDEDTGEAEIPDERLKLIFTCCHPALSVESQVALTLQTLGGLSTEAVAHAFLVPLPTMAQRLVRAKRKIRDAGIPYQVPPPERLAERLDAVLSVIYLIYNAGYTVPLGETLMQTELCEEAIRLARVLNDLLTVTPSAGANAEALGLLALMLLHHARRAARITPDGELVLLDDQDRSRWDSHAIQEGTAVLDQALALNQRGPYQIQAAVAALHAQAATSTSTDWPQIALLYGALLDITPSPVIELNRAVAIAMADGAEQGLALLNALDHEGRLSQYHLFYAARADLYRRSGQNAAARADYLRALGLCENQAERSFLEKRLASLPTD